MKTPIIALLVALLIVIFWPRQYQHQPSADQSSKPPRLEADFQRIWCDQHGAQNGFRLPDGTIADAILNGVIIEIDFAKQKWYEAVGQSLHYSRISGLQPGIVLIVKNKKELKYWHNLVALRDHLYLNNGIFIHLWRVNRFGQTEESR